MTRVACQHNGNSLPICHRKGDFGSKTCWHRLCLFVWQRRIDMSTITNVNTTTAYIAPVAAYAPATTATSFSQTMALAQTSRSWLSTADVSQASRPNIKQFMDRTGAEFLDASELIYGVVGSNTEVRDWTAIMASEDPITAARQATGQMYGRTDITPRTDATYMGDTDTVAKEGNFAVRLLKDEDNQVLDQGLKLIDAQGLLLRDAGNNPKTIARNAWLFGFDTQPLAKLAQASATVSEALGKAVQQASTMPPAANTAVAVSQPPVLVMAPENLSLLGLSGLALLSSPQPVAEPLVTAQKDDQASSPSLEQVLQEAVVSAFEYLDSSTYRSSLFSK